MDNQKLQDFRKDLTELLRFYQYDLMCSDEYEWVCVIDKDDPLHGKPSAHIEDGSTIDYYD